MCKSFFQDNHCYIPPAFPILQEGILALEDNYIQLVNKNKGTVNKHRKQEILAICQCLAQLNIPYLDENQLQNANEILLGIVIYRFLRVAGGYSITAQFWDAKNHCRLYQLLVILLNISENNQLDEYSITRYCSAYMDYLVKNSQILIQSSALKKEEFTHITRNLNPIINANKIKIYTINIKNSLDYLLFIKKFSDTLLGLEKGIRDTIKTTVIGAYKKPEEVITLALLKRVLQESATVETACVTGIIKFVLLMWEKVNKNFDGCSTEDIQNQLLETVDFWTQSALLGACWLVMHKEGNKSLKTSVYVYLYTIHHIDLSASSKPVLLDALDTIFSLCSEEMKQGGGMDIWANSKNIHVPSVRAATACEHFNNEIMRQKKIEGELAKEAKEAKLLALSAVSTPVVSIGM